MSHDVQPIEELPVLERDAFLEAGIDLLTYCERVLRAKKVGAVVLDSAPGVARIINLLSWSVNDRREYLDQPEVFADQVIHFAAHQVVAEVWGAETPASMLFAEAVASACDLYCLGKLSAAGVETEFMADTLASFADYYEQYAAEEEDYESVLERLLEGPHEAMAELAEFLYDTGAQLCRAKDEAEMAEVLIPLADEIWYPMLFHYQVVHWQHDVTRRFPRQEEREETDAERECEERARARLFADEAGFLHAFASAGG